MTRKLNLAGVLGLGSWVLGLLLMVGCVATDRPWDAPWSAEPVNYAPPGGAGPQSTPPSGLEGVTRRLIDLPTAIRLAGANNLEIALVRERVHEAYAQAGIAQEQFLPTVSPGIGYYRHEGRIQGTRGNVLDVDKNNFSTGASLDVRLAPGEAMFQTLAALRRHEASQAHLKATQQTELLAAASGYLDLLEANQAVGVAQQAVEIAQTLEKETEAALRAGVGFKGDVLRARVQRRHNERALMRARDDERQASIRLVTLLHLDPKVQLTPADTAVAPLDLIPTVGLDALMREALANRPELEVAQKELEATQEEEAEADWGPLIPALRASAFGGAFGKNPGRLGSREDYVVGLEWKIGPGGLFDVARQERAEARRRMAEIRGAIVREQVIRQVREAHAMLVSRRQELKTAGDERADAAEAVELNQARQRTGVGLPLEVLQAQEALTRAQRDYLDTVTDYNIAQFRLRVYLGRNAAE